MPRQFKTARQINKLKVIEAAEKLGVSQPTLSAWEGERKSPSIDSLENMADLYRVSADFLLGRCESHIQDSSQPISLQSLPAFHGRPVWSATYGWLLVNAADRVLTFPDGHTLPFMDIASELFISAPPFSEAEPLNGLPNIQFLCSEHHKEKNISIFFLYASLHFQLYSFILKISPPPLCYMLYIEKPQNQESASSANSLALRLSGWLLNNC